MIVFCEAFFAIFGLSLASLFLQRILCPSNYKFSAWLNVVSVVGGKVFRIRFSYRILIGYNCIRVVRQTLEGVFNAICCENQ